jgi:S-formylglutathione hydrolase
MRFTVFVPPAALAGEKVPFLFFLSGLTCNDENFITKAGAQRYAAQRNIGLVCPDTSPRGLGIPGESDAWDFGVGAGFYVDATEEKWKSFRMYSYVTVELFDYVTKTLSLNFDASRVGIFGHSMGGHGALVLALKNPSKFKSASAFAPISNPMNCAWGQKAFSGYLGNNKESWKEWDATELIKTAGGSLQILVDQGTSDNFYPHQLLPQNLADASASTSHKVELRMQEGYDHGYYFISTFIEDHLAHHAKYL